MTLGNGPSESTNGWKTEKWNYFLDDVRIKTGMKRGEKNDEKLEEKIKL